MAKSINEEELDIVLTLKRQGGTGPVDVSCSIRYTIESTDGFTELRGKTIPLTIAQENTVKSFAATKVSELKNLESIE